MNRIYNNKGEGISIDKLLQHDPDFSKTSISNELERMTKGIRNIKKNNLLVYISNTKIPVNKKMKYGNMVCESRSNKVNKYRARLTVVGDR